MEITFSDVEKNYHNFSLSLNMTFPSHSFVSILGPSGSGKSTTLNLVAGIEKADSGSMLFNGEDVSDLPLHKRNIGMVFQDYALFPHLDLEKNIAYALQITGSSRDARKKRTNELTTLLRLGGMEKRNVQSLSGGEQQRVALARAIAAEPDIMLLDEPLSSLDTELRFELRKDIRKLQRRFKTSTIYVTHDQLEAFSLSDSILLMMNGKALQFDNPETIYSRPATKEAAAFLGFKNEFNVVPGNGHNNSADIVQCSSAEGDLYAFNMYGRDAGPLPSKSSGSCMFRPESCLLPASAEYKKTVKNGKGCLFQARVRTYEYHGNAWLVEAETKAGLMKILSPIRPDTDARFTFFVPADALLFYYS